MLATRRRTVGEREERRMCPSMDRRGIHSRHVAAIVVLSSPLSSHRSITERVPIVSRAPPRGHRLGPPSQLAGLMDDEPENRRPFSPLEPRAGGRNVSSAAIGPNDVVAIARNAAAPSGTISPRITRSSRQASLRIIGGSDCTRGGRGHGNAKPTPTISLGHDGTCGFR